MWAHITMHPAQSKLSVEPAAFGACETEAAGNRTIRTITNGAAAPGHHLSHPSKGAEDGGGGGGIAAEDRAQQLHRMWRPPQPQQTANSWERSPAQSTPGPRPAPTPPPPLPEQHAAHAHQSMTHGELLYARACGRKGIDSGADNRGWQSVCPRTKTQKTTGPCGTPRRP